MTDLFTLTIVCPHDIHAVYVTPDDRVARVEWRLCPPCAVLTEREGLIDRARDFEMILDVGPVTPDWD